MHLLTAVQALLIVGVVAGPLRQSNDASTLSHQQTSNGFAPRLSRSQSPQIAQSRTQSSEEADFATVPTCLKQLKKCVPCMMAPKTEGLDARLEPVCTRDLRDTNLAC